MAINSWWVRWSCCCLSLLIFVPSDHLLANEASVTVVQERLEGRAFVMTLNGAMYALEQPYVPEVATKDGKLLLGLTHSGYSEPDPDGKRVVLTMTLQGGQQKLTGSEWDLLRQEGAIVAPPELSVPAPHSVTVDVALLDDRAEESRIRGALGLPKTIQFSANLPVQISWQGKKGNLIYRWLTSPAGLQFTFSFPSRTTWRPSVDPLLAKQVIQNWWMTRFGSSTEVTYVEGLTPMVLDLMTYARFSAPGSPITHFEISRSAMYGRMTTILQAISQPNPNGSIRVALSDLVVANWDPAPNSDASLALNVKAYVVPGSNFLAHPELVKDLTGNGVGLEPLRNDN